MTEIWRPVLGYEGLYEASSLGRIKSIERTVQTFSAKAGKIVPLKRQCVVLKQNKTPSGYSSVTLSKDGVVTTKRVNILVCAAFHGPKQNPGFHACHNDGNKSDNSSDNLRWDSPKANQGDRVRHGTDIRGEQVKNSRLTTADILKIKAAPNIKSLVGIDVSPSHYWRIRKGISWAHVELKETETGGFLAERTGQ